MNKIKGIAAAVMILSLGSLAACSGSGDGSGNGGGSSSEPGFTYTNGSVTIEMNSDAAAVVEKLGEPLDYFESESCAFEGLDKVYTYPEEDKDYVLSVVFMDDTVETEEGIAIGSTKDQVTEAYGDPAEESDTSLVYEKGDTEMTIGFDGDSVSSLAISAVTEE